MYVQHSLPNSYGEMLSLGFLVVLIKHRETVLRYWWPPLKQGFGNWIREALLLCWATTLIIIFYFLRNRQTLENYLIRPQEIRYLKVKLVTFFLLRMWHICPSLTGKTEFHKTWWQLQTLKKCQMLLIKDYSVLLTRYFF